MFSVHNGLPLQQLAVVVAFVVAVAVVHYLDEEGNWWATLRTRLFLGVPWGTLVSIGFVLSFYLFVQGGLHHWYSPVTIPFTAWSYVYPLGMLTAAFAHTGASHLVGNMIGTLTFAPIAEYAFGHYPRETDGNSSGDADSADSLLANPYVRAFVVFPAAVLLMGLLTSLFGLGPLIGFSGVVYALAGFALVYYPYATVLSYVAGQVFNLAYSSFLHPVSTFSSQPVFSTPWFADIAIQCHAVGFLGGILTALWLSQRRGDPTASPRRLFVGSLLFGVSQSFWAVYWFRGNGSFILFRAGGLALVTVLATLVTAAATADERPFAEQLSKLPRRLDSRATFSTPTSRQVAVSILVLAIVVMAAPAVAVNTMTVADDDLPNRNIAVHDYKVTYAENVQNSMVSVVDVSAFGQSTAVNTSGVIVRSRDRGIWFAPVSESQLAFSGSAVVRLGGLGWRQTIVAKRHGWKPVGGDPVYRITLSTNGRTVPVYTSPSSGATPIVGGRNVSIAAQHDKFDVVVEQGHDTERASIPARNESVTLDGVTFLRTGRKLVAEYDDNQTRVTVAKKETYH